MSDMSDSPARSTTDLLIDVSCTADGAFAVNARQCITSWNTAAEELLGYSAHEVLGQPCGAVMRMCNADGTCGTHICKAVSNALSGALTPSVKLAVKTKEGATRWLSMSTLNARSSAGEVEIVHIFHDITETYLAAKRATALPGAQSEAPVRPMTPSHALRTSAAKLAARLTHRERQVLQLLAAGQTTADIAASLSISPITARNHVTKVIEKLEVKTRLQAVVVASRDGLI